MKFSNPIYINTVEDGAELLPNLLKGIFELQGAMMSSIVYPIFTVLLILLTVCIVATLAYSIKKYTQMNTMASLKGFSATAILILIAVDVYLIAFGKTAILFLYINLQKDIFFISTAFIIGFICGKLLLDEKKKRELLP